MTGKEEFAEIEEAIRSSRQLPFTLTVEKVDGNKVYTHNIWGNAAVYVKKDNGKYDLVEEKE